MPDANPIPADAPEMVEALRLLRDSGAFIYDGAYKSNAAQTLARHIRHVSDVVDAYVSANGSSGLVEWDNLTALILPKPVDPAAKAREVLIEVMRHYSFVPATLASSVLQKLEEAGVELRLIDKGDQ